MKNYDKIILMMNEILNQNNQFNIQVLEYNKRLSFIMMNKKGVKR